MNTHSRIAAPIDQADRLETAQAAFGDTVRLSEPFPGRPPLWIEPIDPTLSRHIGAAAQWMIDHRPAIEQALLVFGAIVWRGLAVRGAEQFDRLMESFEPFDKGYVGGTSPRSTIKGKVMESTRTPEFMQILLHQEMTYLPHSPRLLAFHCNEPASISGGATPICDMRGLMEALPEWLQRRFDEDLIFGRHYRDETLENDYRADPALAYPSWQSWLGSADRATIERLLEERDISYEWLDDGTLHTWAHLPSTRVHPVTGEQLYFNQMYAQTQHRECVGEEFARRIADTFGEDGPRPYYATFGDGKILTDEEFDLLHREFQSRRVEFDWQPGDVMLIENKFTSHGRARFAGTRDIQVQLFG